MFVTLFFKYRFDNSGVLRVSGQQQVGGDSEPPSRLLNLPVDGSFVLYLGKHRGMVQNYTMAYFLFFY